MYEKAATAGADEVVFDLEDAVPASEKPRARELVARLINTPQWRRRRVAVRVNPLWSAEHADDVAALATTEHIGLSVVLPKVEGPADVRMILEGFGREFPVQALIESPRGLLNALAIADADGVSALIIGYADLAARLGRRAIPGRPDDWSVHRETVLAAARAAGVDAIDGPFFGLRDAHGLTEATITTRSAGFDGKWAIHPDQVAVINDVFAATAAERAWAHEVLDALHSEGAAAVGGWMVDQAMARQARRLLALGSPNDGEDLKEPNR